jgi:hypothetical protein
MGTQDKTPMFLETPGPPHKMPPQPTVTQIRLNNITECLTISVNTAGILASSLKSPLLEAISNTTQSLLKNMQVNYNRVCHNHESQSTTTDC